MESSRKERFIMAVNFLLDSGLVRNKSELGSKLGVNSSGNMTQMLDLKYPRKPTDEIESIFLSSFPQLSSEWYFTGEGSMLKEEVKDVGTPRVNVGGADGITAPAIREEPIGRPYYDVDFLGGFSEFIDDPSNKPLYYIDYRPLNKEGVFWANVVGDSMCPEYRSGDIIALREIQAWWDFLLYDRIYAIVTHSGQRTIKYVKKSQTADCFRLVPVNKEYTDQDIPKSAIRTIFEVLGGFKLSCG